MQLTLVLQNNNLILYDQTHKNLWNPNSQTSVEGNSHLVLQDDGILKLYNQQNQVRDL